MMSLDTKISQAMVLGAGMGSRMRELTQDRPKPMVEVAGRPIIDHVLARLARAGVATTVVNVHYKPDILETHLKTRQAAPAITISDERQDLLDTGGGVAKAIHHFGQNPFYIHNSDSIWHETGESAFQTLVRAWDSDAMDTLLLLADPATTLGYDGKGDFFRASDGTLSRRTDAEQNAYVFTGVSIAHPRLFANHPEGAFSLNVLWDRAIAAGRAQGIVLAGQWMHVGTPEAVAEASATFENATTNRGTPT